MYFFHISFLWDKIFCFIYLFSVGDGILNFYVNVRSYDSTNNFDRHCNNIKKRLKNGEIDFFVIKYPGY